MKYLRILSCYLALLSPIAHAAQPIVFTSPPRGQLEDEKRIYQPIADFLSRELKTPVVYQHPNSWLHYKKSMRHDTNMDIAFDGPHFVSWRQGQGMHEPVAKLPQPHIWHVIVKRNSNITKIEQLSGQKVCLHGPPNFGTLTLLTHFPNTARQPIEVPIQGWKTAYTELVKDACVATILPKTNLYKFDPKLEKVRVIHQHFPYPNQAITVSKKLPPELRLKIRDALLSDKGQLAMEGLRKRFAKGERLERVNDGEYSFVSGVLEDVYGFGYTFND